MGVSKRTRQRELKKNLFAIFLILVFACVVFSINSIGNFIAKNVIAPVIDLTKEKNENTFSDTIKTEQLVTYLVCAGEMPDLSEAETLKTMVQEKGGGGYIFNQDSEYSVIYSAFLDKESAEEEGKKLSSDFAPTVIKIAIDETVIRITGKEKHLKTIHSCFSSINQCSKTLTELSLKLNNTECSPLEALKEAQKIKNTLSDLQNDLKEINSSNVKVLALSDMLALSQTILNELPLSDDSAFNQKLTYTACAYVCNLYEFYSSLE